MSKLKTIIDRLDDGQLAALAKRAGTSSAYLRQLGWGYSVPSVKLAVAIERACDRLRKRLPDLPPMSVYDIADDLN